MLTRATYGSQLVVDVDITCMYGTCYTTTLGWRALFHSTCRQHQGAPCHPRKHKEQVQNPRVKLSMQQSNLLTIPKCVTSPSLYSRGSRTARGLKLTVAATRSKTNSATIRPLIHTQETDTCHQCVNTSTCQPRVANGVQSVRIHLDTPAHVQPNLARDYHMLKHPLSNHRTQGRHKLYQHVMGGWPCNCLQETQSEVLWVVVMMRVW
jgi:hypothetical protein